MIRGLTKIYTHELCSTQLRIETKTAAQSIQREATTTESGLKLNTREEQQRVGTKLVVGNFEDYIWNYNNTITNRNKTKH